jgi:tRNA(Ile)-lysidine synthase
VIEKEHCWILESEGKIVWIFNDRIDNRFRITSGTKKALIIKVRSLVSDNGGTYLAP